MAARLGFRMIANNNRSYTSTKKPSALTKTASEKMVVDLEEIIVGAIICTSYILCDVMQTTKNIVLM